MQRSGNVEKLWVQIPDKQFFVLVGTKSPLILEIKLSRYDLPPPPSPPDHFPSATVFCQHIWGKKG